MKSRLIVVIYKITIIAYNIENVPPIIDLYSISSFTLKVKKVPK